MSNALVTEEVQNKSPKQVYQESNDLMPQGEQAITKQVSNDQLYLEYEKELAQPLPPLKLWYKVAFVFLGIASLAGWNAILTAFDFFGQKYPKGQFLDVTFYFPIPIMITNFLAGLACPALARRFNYNQRIAYCLMGVCCTMIIVTIIAIFYNTTAGYWISFCILFIQGFIDSVNTNSLIALAGSVHPSINNIYWTSTALSGLTMNVIRLIALAILGDSEQSTNICTALYFCFAAVIYIFSSMMQIIFTKCDYFKLVERRSFLKNQIENKITTQTEMQNVRSTGNVQTDVNLDQHEKQTSSLKKNAFFQYLAYLSQVFKYSGCIPLYLVLIYIQTFMMFPGVSIFQKTTYEIIKFPWAGVFMILLFNLGDLVGKYIGGIKMLQKLYLTYSIVISRFIFYVFFLLISRHKGSEDLQNDVFSWFCIFLFAVTNGQCTTALMNLGPKNVKDPKIVDLINFIGGFAITFGISIGTFLALPLVQE
ncbi:equilibrative nucleoside transporter family protein (macronuclear) [Tetrahymena thermophila SB210]|uniref:Equilibrative nucleoside transporter family protein n=1 Tax=Tetrahymena thermophila (strain SB210) TaxID=312017 RepID=I7MG87_TETTS|nr:equilibrative nucleoside transporter family protein [Tetrahymena thermophila SB210]EAS01236.1 equilibrative nucleoside transporter family protein [Tetrahymena thermophila SB210]|eukprot:XP_001021481.1 equilibrative nucleoside transporter family protein [Tetrahymena thermophila SB210]